VTQPAAVRPIGIGLISVGWMGTAHTRAYTAVPGIYPELGVAPQLIMAADTAPARVEYATATLGYAEGTTDYREVLADPRIEAVSICAPNFLHAEIGIAAAEAGKHYWIEKPAGRSRTETAAVAAATAAAGVISTVGFNYRHAPAVEYLRTMIADGRLGRITNVRVRFFAGYSADPRGALSWRFQREFAGSGVLGDLATHAADLGSYLLGPITDVTATTAIVHRQRPKLAMGQSTHFAVIEGGELGEVENEDYAGALVRFAGGAVGTIEASRVAVGPDCGYGIEVFGTEGSAQWEFERMNELVLSTGRGTPEAGYVRINANAAFGDFSRFQPGAGIAMGYDDLKTIEAKKFLAAVIGGPQDQATIADAVAAAAFVEAVETSVASGRWERLAS
jgi:predicted dehydrogenase